eukprot:jgi/Psemu1/21777/gm1.21777_g
MVVMASLEGYNLLDRISRFESTSTKPFPHIPGLSGFTRATADFQEAQLDALDEAQCTSFREESNTTKVHLVNTYFTSRKDVGDWCTMHANNNLVGYLNVVDPQSLLVIAFNSKGGTNSNVDFESSTRKSAYSSSDAALVMKSFWYTVPEVFTGRKVSADPMTLPAIPSYSLQTRLDNVVKTTRQDKAAINISMEGQALAQTCIQDAKTFNSGLIQWIYVSHCVGAIFEHLHKAWKVRAKLGVNKEKQAALEFTQDDLSNHSVIQTVLNKHMRHRAVMQDEMNTHLAALKKGQEEVMKEPCSLKVNGEQKNGPRSQSHCRLPTRRNQNQQGSACVPPHSPNQLESHKTPVCARARPMVYSKNGVVEATDLKANLDEETLRAKAEDCTNTVMDKATKSDDAVVPEHLDLAKPPLDFLKEGDLLRSSGNKKSNGTLPPTALEHATEQTAAVGGTGRKAPLSSFEAQICLKPVFDGPAPLNADQQTSYSDPGIKALVKEKVFVAINKGCIELSDIKFLEAMMFMFHVPKGETNVRIVYGGTKSGLNDALYAPWFALPTVDSMLQWVVAGTWLADKDYDKQFLSFLLHPDLRKYCGIDHSQLLASSSDKPGVTGVWMHNAMGLKSSPYNSMQGFVVKANHFWQPLGLKEPIRQELGASQPPGMKSYEHKTMEIIQYVDGVCIMAPMENLDWKCSSKMAKGLCWLDLQDAAHKRRCPSQEPGSWVGATVSTGRVCKGVTKDRWSKLQDQIQWIALQINVHDKHTKARYPYLEAKSETEGSRPLGKIHHKRLELCVGSLVYVAMTYTSMVPYLKGLYLTLNSWRPHRDEKRWTIPLTQQDKTIPPEGDPLTWDSS